jgi:acetoin utilization deacetylase AcuC-like enzyme
MIIDLDAHQGNGHARDFAEDSKNRLCFEKEDINMILIANIEMVYRILCAPCLAGRVYILDMYNCEIYPQVYKFQECLKMHISW